MVIYLSVFLNWLCRICIVFDLHWLHISIIHYRTLLHGYIGTCLVMGLQSWGPGDKMNVVQTQADQGLKCGD